MPRKKYTTGTELDIEIQHLIDKKKAMKQEKMELLVKCISKPKVLEKIFNLSNKEIKKIAEIIIDQLLLYSPLDNTEQEKTTIDCNHVEKEDENTVHDNLEALPEKENEDLLGSGPFKFKLGNANLIYEKI